MLANLLPGIRELRAPLAAGYIWLVALWLMLHSRLAGPEQAGGPLATIRDLGSVLSELGVGVALSFVAYLLGSLSQSTFDGPIRSLGALARPGLMLQGDPEDNRAVFILAPPRRARYLPAWRRPSTLGLRGEVSSAGIAAISVFVQRRLREAVEKVKRSGGQAPEEAGEQGQTPINSTVPEIFLLRYVTRVVEEFRIAETRLIGESTELYSQFDRSRAEAEFRRSLLMPLLALLTILAFTWSWYWLLGLLALYLLFRDAVRLQEVAGDTLANAISAGKISVPLLERLNQDVGADLAGAQLSGEDLSGMLHVLANLNDANLRGAKLDGTIFLGADLSSSQLGTLRSGDDLQTTSMKLAYLRQANLRYADLTGADLSDSDLQGATLSQADLHGAVLQSAQLQGAKLIGANLEDADLSLAVLADADLQGARFVHTVLASDLRRADLSHCTFEDVELDGCDLEGAIFAGANLHGLDLRYTDFSDVDLRGAKLSGANLENVSFVGFVDEDLWTTHTEESVVKGAKLEGALLDSAVLKRADLRKANLKNADLTGADLSDADLRDADLTGAKLEGSILTGAKIDGATFDAGYLAPEVPTTAPSP